MKLTLKERAILFLHSKGLVFLRPVTLSILRDKVSSIQRILDSHIDAQASSGDATKDKQGPNAGNLILAAGRPLMSARGAFLFKSQINVGVLYDISRYPGSKSLATTMLTASLCEVEVSALNSAVEYSLKLAEFDIENEFGLALCGTAYFSILKAYHQNDLTLFVDKYQKSLVTLYVLNLLPDSKWRQGIIDLHMKSLEFICVDGMNPLSVKGYSAILKYVPKAITKRIPGIRVKNKLDSQGKYISLEAKYSCL